MTSKSQEKQNKAAIIDDQLTRMYDFKKRLGKGAYGIVWKALDKRNNKTVAVKKIFDAFRDETDAQRTFREIVFLKAFRNHANVVSLLNVHKASNNLDMYLVFEHMESDLHNIIKKGNILKDVHKRYVMYQLINAVRFIHSGNVIHRDLKPCNILLDNKCRCKLADFGLARSVATQMSNASPDISNNMPEVLLTDYVATRWYRAPEILVASKKYTKGIDMWSLGCILGEMLRGKPLFQGSSTVNQIEKIVATLPNISEEEIEAIGGGFGTALLNQQSQVERGPTLDELLKDAPSDAINLSKALLQLDPLGRLTANEALQHPYVQKFRNTSDEIELNVDILPPFNDDVRLSVHEYRDKVYEMSQISPYRGTQTRPSSKQANGSTSKTREPSRKAEASSNVGTGPVAKKILPVKKSNLSSTMPSETRALTKNAPHLQYPNKSKIPGGGGDGGGGGGGGVGNEILNKCGSCSSLSRDSSTKSYEKTTKQPILPATKKHSHKRTSSPAMGIDGAGGDKINAANKMKTNKGSPPVARGRSSSLDLSNKMPNVASKLPGVAQNLYADHKKSQSFQAAVEAAVFGHHNNQNLEPNRKLTLPNGSSNQTNNNNNNNFSILPEALNKKVYDNSPYHLTNSSATAAAVNQKSLKKFDNLMINRKQYSINLPGQVPIQANEQQLPKKSSNIEQNPIIFNTNANTNNKNSYNIDIQRSVPTINGNNHKNSTSHVRNSKSEQSTLETTNMGKKSESYCYERRLRRLEEEIERYKSDVNSFCKQSYASTLTVGANEKNSKVPVKTTTPNKVQTKVVSYLNPSRKHDSSSHKTKLPSVAATNSNNNEVTGYSKNEYLYQQQQQQQTTHYTTNNPSPSRHCKDSGISYAFPNNVNSKFYQTNGGDHSNTLTIHNHSSGGGGGGGGGGVGGGGGAGGIPVKPSHDFSNSRFTKYSSMKSTNKANQYIPQYHPELNAPHHSNGTNHQTNHHYSSKFPFQYHHDATAASMRSVTVSKII